jgi:hypothetical protein
MVFVDQIKMTYQSMMSLPFPRSNPRGLERMDVTSDRCSAHITF